jgi:hypothetical protein
MKGLQKEMYLQCESTQWVTDKIEYPVQNAKMLLMAKKRGEGLISELPMGLVVAIAKLVWIGHFVISSGNFRRFLRKKVWDLSLWNLIAAGPRYACFVYTRKLVQPMTLTLAEKIAWTETFESYLDFRDIEAFGFHIDQCCFRSRPPDFRAEDKVFHPHKFLR